MKKETKLKNLLPKNVSVSSNTNCITYEISPEEIVQTCEFLYLQGLPFKMITVCDERSESGFFKICYIFGVPECQVFLAPTILVKNDFPSLTPLIHQASIFERKIYSFFGLIPKGHPNLRSLILHENWPDELFPLRKDFAWNTRPSEAHGTFQFSQIEGEGIYEIPVGPVHAGIIEPGHFRFSVAGEEILFLEPRLGYSHKGSEKLFEILPLKEKLILAERISGDSSFSHSLAFCQAVESLSDCHISKRCAYSRVIFSELERLANHLGDIGAIMIDTGFNFGGAQGARLRECVMQINDRLGQNRFLRGINTFGGSLVNIENNTAKKIIEELEYLEKDFLEVIQIAENSSSLIDRLKNTGLLDEKIGKDHGVVGIIGKAIGILHDARKDFPYGAYDQFDIEVVTEKTGDVYARFKVRVREVHSSIKILLKALYDIQSIHRVDVKEVIKLKKNSYAIGITEGWRGDILYFVATDAKGEITRVDVRDPSFLNWTVLGYAGKGNMVPDFPLINKSFNLSYSGNDL